MLIITILIGIIILSLVILAHEFGHFFAAKMSGVKVEEFGLGIPPRICRLFKKGETVYSLNWIPFGAFNKILGQEEKSRDPRAYCNKGVWTRIFIVGAGIGANIILAWILLTVWFWLAPVINLPNYVVVVKVEPNSSAERVGLEPNDLILKIDNFQPKKVTDVSSFTRAHQGEEVELLIKHRGKKETKKIKLAENSPAPLGVVLAETNGENLAIKWYQAPWLALKEMYTVVVFTFSYIISAFASLFGGPKVSFELTGPIGIVAFISQTVSVSWLFLIRLTAIISLGLAFINFLPIPAMDGGHLFFLGLEAGLGKKVISHEHEKIIHTFGFIFIIILSIIIAYLDIVRLK